MEKILIVTKGELAISICWRQRKLLKLFHFSLRQKSRISLLFPFSQAAETWTFLNNCFPFLRVMKKRKFPILFYFPVQGRNGKISTFSLFSMQQRDGNFCIFFHLLIPLSNRDGNLYIFLFFHISESRGQLIGQEVL